LASFENRLYTSNNGFIIPVFSFFAGQFVNLFLDSLPLVAVLPCFPVIEAVPGTDDKVFPVTVQTRKSLICDISRLNTCLGS
jgi:hypothetical protein